MNNSATSLSGTAGDISTMLFGSGSGGLTAELTGGNFWQGATIGLTVSALNHVAHRLSEPKNGELYIFDDTDRVNGQGYTGIGGKLADAGEKAYRFVSKDGRVDTDGSRSSGGNQNIQINITLLINPWLVVKEFPQMEIISLKN
ncbi:MAG: hypothetical protein RBT61_04385 [Candidatus Kapabacteria bacterium]|jgi:hypothetical protein|nr:hypothetical protein [Candidatus Kapabacteria bacterium]